ncbi:MAG: ABC transporter permease [Ruminococcaceae bacterium]|nr:ABC transporter permease [Oscillospiraceae bacterium]
MEFFSEFFSYLGGTAPSIAAQGMIWGIMAIGVFITFRILDIADLTVDGSIVTGAAVCIVAFQSGMNIWVAILLATLAGMLCGLVTGLLHTALGIPPILAGILTQQSLWTVNLMLAGSSLSFTFFEQDQLLVVPLEERIGNTDLVLVGFVAVVIAILYWFFGTELGASLRATGNNPNMSRAQGINTSFAKVLGLVISNGIVALSGALLVQYSNGYNINMGRGAIVIGLAAVVVGEAIVSKISSGFIPRLIGVILGGIIYFLVYQLVLFFDIEANLLKMLSAAIIAVFLGVPYLKKRYGKKKAKKEVKTNA